MKTAKVVFFSLLVLALAAPGWAGWQLVDDFEGSTLGPVTGQTADSGQVWNSLGEDSRSPYYGTTVPIFAVHTMDGGQTLVVEGTGGLRDHAWVGLGTPIAEGTVGTIYCRVKSIEDVALTLGMHVNFGGYDDTGIGNDTKTTTFGIINNYASLPLTNLYVGGVTGSVSDKTEIQVEQWYECWIVVDLTGETDGVPDPTKFFYNAYAAGPGLTGMVQFNVAGNPNFLLRVYTPGNGITSFSLIQQTNNNYGETGVEKEPIAFDDIYVDTLGENLTSAYQYKKLAHNPTPADGAVEVPQATTLSWYTGLADVNDPDSWATSGITHHHVYMSSGNPADPNVYYKTTIAASAQTGSWTPPLMALDNVYYWRVDEGFNSNPNDPGVLKSKVWVFDIVHSVPTIVTQPVSVVAAPGSNPQFTVAALNPQTGDTSGLNYQWYNATTGLPLANGAQYSNTTTPALTVLDAQYPADNLLLYCRVTMPTGFSDTDTVSLGVKKRLTYWTLDAANYSGSAHADAEGTQPAVPFTSGTATFTAGANGAANGALVIDSSNWCTAGAFNPAEFTGEVSVSCWLKWDGTFTTSDFQSLVNKRNTSAIGGSFYYTGGIRSAAGEVKIDSNLSGNDVLATPGVVSGAWVHVVFTVANLDGKADVFNWTEESDAEYKLGKVYINGLVKDSGDFRFGPSADAPVCLGAINTDGELLFKGAMDDVAIYNYALSPSEVGSLYSAINGPFCVENPVFDFDGSCIVDLGDFAMFAAQWLDCNIYPTCIETIE